MCLLCLVVHVYMGYLTSYLEPILLQVILRVIGRSPRDIKAGTRKALVGFSLIPSLERQCPYILYYFCSKGEG